MHCRPRKQSCSLLLNERWTANNDTISTFFSSHFRYSLWQSYGRLPLSPPASGGMYGQDRHFLSHCNLFASTTILAVFMISVMLNRLAWFIKRSKGISDICRWLSCRTSRKKELRICLFWGGDAVHLLSPFQPRYDQGHFFLQIQWLQNNHHKCPVKKKKRQNSAGCIALEPLCKFCPRYKWLSSWQAIITIEKQDLQLLNWNIQRDLHR